MATKAASEAPEGLPETEIVPYVDERTLTAKIEEILQINRNKVMLTVRLAIGRCYLKKYIHMLQVIENHAESVVGRRRRIPSMISISAGLWKARFIQTKSN